MRGQGARPYQLLPWLEEAPLVHSGPDHVVRMSPRAALRWMPASQMGYRTGSCTVGHVPVGH